MEKEFRKRFELIYGKHSNRVVADQLGVGIKLVNEFRKGNRFSIKIVKAMAKLHGGWFDDYAPECLHEIHLSYKGGRRSRIAPWRKFLSLHKQGVGFARLPAP